MSNAESPSPPDFLTGVIAPMFTPCTRELEIDLDGARSMADWLVSCGCVRTVFARSGMGRMFTFTVEETKRLAQTLRDTLPDRVGLVVGAGGEWREKGTGGHPDPERYTAQAVELTQYLQEIGADAAVHVIPEALPCRGGENPADVTYRYISAIHSATNIPILLYQPPGLSVEYRLTVPLVERLLALPRVAGAKITTTDDSVFGPIAKAVAGKPFALICGHEGYFLKGLKQGAVGVIGQGCMASPEILYAVWRAFTAGDMPRAERAAADVWRAVAVTEGLEPTVALKQYLIRKGVSITPADRGWERAPFPASVIDRVERELDSLCAAYRSA